LRDLFVEFFRSKLLYRGGTPVADAILTRDQPMDADMAPYHQPEPYPIPINLPRDPHRGQWLSMAYAGRDSEMTALSQYVVHHETLTPEYPQISKDVLQIGIIEMFHLDMLGSCLKQLGVRPILATQGRYWSAGYIKYGRTPRERILLDIQGERACIALYRRIIRNIHSPALEALLARIIRDEELHITLFEKMLDTLK
jgi:bacterioferritin